MMYSALFPATPLFQLRRRISSAPTASSRTALPSLGIPFLSGPFRSVFTPNWNEAGTEISFRFCLAKVVSHKRSYSSTEIIRIRFDYNYKLYLHKRTWISWLEPGLLTSTQMSLRISIFVLLIIMTISSSSCRDIGTPAPTILLVLP